MTAKKFFEDNINRIPVTDPVMTNLNKGFLALAKEQELMRSEIQMIRDDLRQVARMLQQLASR